MIRLLSIFLILFSSSGFSADRDAPKRKTFSFSIQAGARASTNLTRRGATLYDSWQLSPFLYFGFLEDRIQFLVNSIEYNQFVLPDVLRARTKLSNVSDRPFFRTGEPTSFRNQRRTSYEWTSTLELFLPDRARYWGELDLRYAKDLQAHSGHYLELVPRVTLAKLFMESKGNVGLQPQAFASFGWGDRRHNSYQYGAEAEQPGFNNLAYGLMLISPVRIDSHYPVLTLSRYQVLGDMKHGGLVRDKTSGYTVSALIAFAITK